MSRIIIIGYGGHSYMACDIIKHTRQEILGYFEQVEKTKNPFQIPYLGKENQQGSSDLLSQNEWFVAFDNNHFRKFITQKLVQRNVGTPCSLIHPTSLIGEGVAIGMGTMVAAGSIINILTTMGVSTIVNTNATVGYECKLAD